MCCFIGVRKKWKHLLNNSHTELKKMNASHCGDPDASRNKRSLIGGDFNCYFFGNVKEMEGKQNLTASFGFCTATQCQTRPAVDQQPSSVTET
jgi:hypothetical protein